MPKEKYQNIDTKNISFFLQIFKETFYRKYDKENYILLSQDIKYLIIIKSNILSKIITREDNIDESILNNLLKIINNILEIHFILNLFTKLSQLMHFILVNFAFLNDKYILSQKFIEPTEIIEKIEEDNLLNIKESHRKILEMELENNFYFVKFEKLFKKYIKNFSYCDLDNLIILREMINNQSKYKEELKELEIEINNAIHQTGIYLVDDLKPSFIINFITNIDKNYYDKKELETIIKAINIYELTTDDFHKFNGIWNKVNKDNNEYLINLLLEKIQSMKDLGLIFQLVPLPMFNNNSAFNLENKFKSLYYSFNEKICTNIVNDICKILFILTEVSFKNCNNFLNFIEQNFSQKLLNELYLNIIKDIRNRTLSQNEIIKIKIINFFTKQNNINDMQSVIYILENINESNNIEFIKDFLDSLKKFIITKEDFFVNEFNNKFNLYINIQKIFYNKDFSFDNDYFKKSNEALRALSDKIKSLEFSYEEIKLMKIQIKTNINIFKEKLSLINHNNNFDFIFNFLKEGIERVDKFYNELLMIRNFYTFFFESEKEFINDINNKIENLNKSTNVNIYLNELEDLLNKNIRYQSAKKYLILNESKFFIDLYNKLKKKNTGQEEIMLFNSCLEYFDKFEIINNWKEYYSIDQILYYEEFLEELKQIINENKYDKKACISLISKELDIIHKIYKKACISLIGKESDIINKTYNIQNNIIEKKEINKSIFNNLMKEKIEEGLKEYEEKEEFKMKDNFIEQYLIYLPFLDTLKRVLSSIKLLIELFEVKQTEFYSNIDNYLNEINKTNKITLKKIRQIIDYLKNLENIGIDIASFSHDDNITVLVDFLSIAYNNVEGIKFAFGKTNEEIRALSEFVGENENTKIQIRDIQDFMNVCNFFENLKIFQVDDDAILIEEFKAAFTTTVAFGTSFKNFLNNFKEIKSVYEEYLDKPEVSRKKIEQILKLSNICIYFDINTRQINIRGSYTDILRNDKQFDFKDLQELHDRALLFSNKTFDNISNNVTDNFKQKQENSHKFVEIVENINILVSYLVSLYIKGYPYHLQVDLIIKDFKAMDKEKKYEIKDIIKYYKELTNNLENAQTEAYKEKELIRLIYGQQFYDLFNYFINSNRNIDIMPLLKKISNNKIIKLPDGMFNGFIEKNNFKSMINIINNILIECLKINNNICNKDLYHKNIIKRDYTQIVRPGFFSWSADELNFEIQIIAVYKKLTDNLPLPITLMLCTKETNEEEITSFIYRAVLCPFPVLFIIINSDNLELSNAQYFLWILESLYNKNRGNIHSTLLILFNNTNSDLRKQLTLLNGHDYFIFEDIIINDINNIKNDNELNPIKVWTSDAAGIGKSSMIKFEAEKLHLKYIYFPIGGSFTRKEMIERIIKLDINKNKYANNYLHIDIYDSDKESSIIIREFLLSLLITRHYSFDEKIFYLGYDSKIIIEIPTGFYNMQDKFKLLNYFTTEQLKLKNLPDLREVENIEAINENIIENINNNININGNVHNSTNKKTITDIQLVTNILKMLENKTIQDETFDINIKHEIIPLIECQNTINKYFTLKEGNYYQKMAFIHILADQFRKFCSSFYLDPKTLIHNQDAKILRLNRHRKFFRKKERNVERDLVINKNEKITNIRKIMIENLVKLTLYFVKGPYNKIVLNQKNTNIQLFGEFNENKINEIANQSLSNKDEIISFEKINPSLVFFNEDIQTFSIITTSKPEDSEYKQLLKLYNSQLDLEYEQDSLINYRKLTHEEFLPHVKNILNLNTLSEEKIKKIIGSYCFTSDNFIKMILILLRTRAGIPVVMMGETGCGKTSLIKILSTLLNKGKNNLEIMNIHAGIKDQDIIKFIENVNEKANNGIENNNPNDKIWVFFDEINTCNSMGLLSEIFYKNSYYGKKLNDKLTFIAACNPYRLKIINKEEEQEDFCLNIPDKNYYYSKQKLVYLVNPLPHSLLTSIFDFGNLSSEDEKKYIKSIVKETVRKYNINDNIEKFIVDEIIVCQNFIRKYNDVSSVSLRELRRFNILFDFFVDYLKKKKEQNDIDIYTHSLCLCLYFCYYIRLSNNKLRKELEKEIKNFKMFKGKSYFDIIQKEKLFIASKVKIPLGIAKNSTLLENIFVLFVCIVNKIPLIICGKPGTSKSLSFQILYDSMKGDRSEDEFFHNYPELLVFSYQGSKTSTSEAIEKVFKKARKCLEKNKDKENRKINENNIILNKDILNNININNDIINNNLINIDKNINQIHNKNIFNNNDINTINKGNENIINNNKNEYKRKRIIHIKDEVIPVFYFDEMGLAEDSPNNPLKVIHSELEYDDNEQKIAFVGISNWRLDASKMNRTIFLGVPPLEEQDLVETAREISHNLDIEISSKYKELFSFLVKTYCEYKEFTKKTTQSEFHGLRDFYHLIKNAMQYLLSEKNIQKNIRIKDDEEKINENINENINIREKAYEIGIKSLQRNFDGLKEPFNSFIKIKEIFDKFYKDISKNYNNNGFNTFDCLKDNIKDNNSRYLLIIMESSMSLHLLSYIMQELNKKYVFYSGSQLNEDLNKEKYNEKLLNKIQLSLENGDILVLKNMENIYPSLYNLFNQNFTMLGGKKFARIAFANYKSYSVVNDSFRAIILVDEEQIKEKLEDPPFLNRFEKHVFSFDYLMNEMELKITNKIINYIDLVISFNKQKCKIDLKKQILWYNKEEIKGIIFKEHYKIKNNKEKIIENENDLYDNILINLSKLFSQDILASIISINPDLKKEKMPQNLLNHYESNHYYNFRDLIKSDNIFNYQKSTKLIIYTFSKLLQPCIKEGEVINSNTLGLLSNEDITEKIITSIRNELNLENILDDFYNNNRKSILIFKFGEEDLNKMNQIKIKINQFETEKKNNERYKDIIKRKHFIFLISITRQKIEKMGKKSGFKKVMINDLISNIDEEYNQFFIDNLHGKKDINIISLISKNPAEYITEIFNKKSNQLLKMIQQIFSYFTYEFKNETQNNILNNFERYSYIKGTINLLYNNEYILNLLKVKIVKEFSGNFNEIIKSIFIKGTFEKNDIEFIDVIYKVLYEKVFLLLFKFIFKSEKDHFLNPFLQNNEFIQKHKESLPYIEKYINNFNFLLVNVVERINSNQIVLILNLSLPLSKKWYDAINTFIENNIKEDYINNEENLRLNQFEENEIDIELGKYSKMKNDFVNNVKGEILRIEGLNELLKTKNIYYIQMIYTDFISIYLSKNFNKDIDLGIQFLDILIQLRLNINNENRYSFIDNNKDKINLQDSFSNLQFNDMNSNKINIYNKNEELNIKYDEDTLCNILTFLICYSDEIYSMLDIFYTLNKYLNEFNFFNEWKNLIVQKDIKYELNDNNPLYTREVNESFFIIYESLIKCIFNNPDKYKSIPDDIFYEYLDSIQKISKIAIQIYYKLYLPSKEMYTLQILINIFGRFDSCKNKKHINNIQEIFIDIINNIIRENVLISKHNYKEMEENYKNLPKILNNLIDKEKNEKEYSLLLNNIFIYRFNKSLVKPYRNIISIIFFRQITEPQLKYILPILKKLINDIEPKNINDDLPEKECIDKFMDIFIKGDKDKNELYKIINTKNSDILDSNILYYFECECDLYFKKISNKKLNDMTDNKKILEYMQNILFNLSLKYFKKAMSYYLGENNFNENSNKLGMIYCIAYIKNYLKKFAEFINYNKNKRILNLEEIVNALLCQINSKKIFSLKIFFFKCLYNNENKNYLEFIESIKNKDDIQKLLTHDEFSNLFVVKEKNHSYNYSFLNIDSFDIYNTLNNIIDINIDNIEASPNFKDICNYTNNNNNFKGFDLLYNVLVNKYLLDLYGNANNNEELSTKANKIFNKFNRMNVNLHNNSQTLINYFINKSLFISKVLPKLKQRNNDNIDAINSDQIYILLFCAKLVISLQISNNNIFSLFYANKNVKNTLIDFLKNNYIPGAFQEKNEFIDSYYEIESHLRNQPSDNAIYICSCGKYYIIPPCGFPVQTSKCVKCNLTIGGRNHRLERRPNHYRIFLNEQSKIKEFKKTFADKHMNYKYLDDFKREIIDPLLNTPSKGIGKMTKEIINKTGSNIRNINELSFRVMNLVLCSHLLISHILDILDNKDMSDFFSEETSCFENILDNWAKISELLNKIQINNIQIYMNVIYQRLIEIYSGHNINDINTVQGRDNIEKEINLFINDANTIKEQIKIYERYNQNIINSSPNNISSIIQELYPKEFYSNEEEYPFFKYLYYYNYPNINNLYNIIESNANYKSKYPLTYNILKYNTDNKKEIELLKYIPKINKKLNHLIHSYSYKISRDEALKQLIKDEYKKKENNLFIINNKKTKDVKEYIDDIVKLFRKFKNIELQWGCHKLKQMDLDQKSSLASILLDDNEPGYYLSSIYKKLIEYQNLFLDNIINCNAQNGLLHCFVKQLNNEIMVQDAGFNEIIKLDFEGNNNNLKLFSSLDELIFINTTKVINYNKFNYELDEIETELGNIILPGIRKFKSSDDELRFIIYMFEGYRGKNSKILTNFNEKYPPQELNHQEKAILNKFIQNNENDDYKTFLFSIQLLIDYIQKAGKEENMKISEVIRNMPDQININENVKYFFSNLEITINKLVRIFELFEYLCWDQIKDNLLDEFMKQIDEDKKETIIKYFKKNEDKKDNYITKLELASAVRKFISRYLAGKRSQSEINEDKMLFDYLNRADLWVKNIDNPKFEKEYFEMKILKITVGEAMHFYDLLGDDSSLLNLHDDEKYIKLKNNIENNEDIIENKEENPNRIIIIEDDKEEREINTSSRKKKKEIKKEVKEEDEEKENIEGIQKKKQRRILF